MSWLLPFALWIKAFHVISVVAWMAGLLYLPRLFVYHAAAPVGSAVSETFKVMERRLLRAIMNPAMIAAFLFGGLLLAMPGIVDWASLWIYVKLAAVAGLAVIHHILARCRTAFAADRNTRSQRYYRAINEIPTLLLIVIVVMVVVKPL